MSQRPTRAVTLVNGPRREDRDEEESAKKKRRIDSNGGDNSSEITDDSESEDQTQIFDICPTENSTQDNIDDPTHAPLPAPEKFIKTRSWVHEHLKDVTRINGKLESAECKVCKKKISLVNGTKPAKDHLKIHGIVEKKDELSEKNMQKQLPANTDKLEKEFRKCQALWVAETSQPFTSIEHPAYKRMMASHESWTQTGSAYTVKQEVHHYYEVSQETLK